MTISAPLRTALTVATISFLSVGVSVKAQALSLTVGAPGDPGGGDCAPFGCVIRYQQVYNSNLFSSPFNINTLSFFNKNYSSGSISAANYLVRLSTTDKAVNGLSSTFDDNTGADSQVFFQGNLGGSIVGGKFDISGNSFAYDPSKGNLLLDILKSGGGFDFSVYLDSRNGTADPGSISRVYSFDSSAIGSPTDNYGLVTQFNGSAAAIPTPALLPGLIGLGMGVLRKRKAEAAEGSEA